MSNYDTKADAVLAVFNAATHLPVVDQIYLTVVDLEIVAQRLLTGTIRRDNLSAQLILRAASTRRITGS